MLIYDVFLCHSSEDKPYVKQIYTHLKTHNLTVWFDQEELHAGENLLDTIQEAALNSAIAFICIGNHTLGGWQKIELDSLRVLATERRIKIIPLLLPTVSDMPDSDEFLFLKGFAYFQWRSGLLEDLEELVDNTFEVLKDWSQDEIRRLEQQRNHMNSRLREIDQKITYIKLQFPGEELHDGEALVLRHLASVKENIQEHAIEALIKFPIIGQKIIDEELNFAKFCIDLETILDFLELAFKTENLDVMNHINDIDLSINDEVTQNIAAKEIYVAFFEIIQISIPLRKYLEYLIEILFPLEQHHHIQP